MDGCPGAFPVDENVAWQLKVVSPGGSADLDFRREPSDRRPNAAGKGVQARVQGFG